jgi:beta-galactosidase
VPGLVDLAVPPFRWQVYDFFWYRTTFTVPSHQPGKISLLRIEQAMFGTLVWLNGQKVGGDIACYTSQEYDISGLLRSDTPNELCLRVGARNTLPTESAVGNDQERHEWIPGVWGDVEVVTTGNPRIENVQIIPDITNESAEVRISVRNHSEQATSTKVAVVVRDREGLRVAASDPVNVQNGPGADAICSAVLQLRSPQLWSPENPYLYTAEAILSSEHGETDRLATRFGMREFAISGGDFMLNGQRIYLRGGNIAFHRFLSDPDRCSLPWDLEWIRRVLIDIPKTHHFNFFRNHLGQMYNRWYDIADEGGMLLQNEWMFWTTSGTKEQIRAEFTRWLRDNWNHPSIVIWDALNESNDDILRNSIIPAMKQLDPTRPWEPADFPDHHPYIYSLGPVLNDRKFGFTESIEAIHRSKVPSVVSEFLWWWLDCENRPAPLMEGVVERWLGKEWTEAECVARQSFLARELVELFRRIRADAIQPFVYLSNSTGPTANWFLGNIRDLKPKPVLEALKNAFAPFGVSLEIWDQHFFPGERRRFSVYCLNDHHAGQTGTLRYGVATTEGAWLTVISTEVTVEKCGTVVFSLNMEMPVTPGEYIIRAELWQGETFLADSLKIAHVITPGNIFAPAESSIPVQLFAGSPELKGFFDARGFRAHNAGRLSGGIIVVGEGMLKSHAYHSQIEDVSRRVAEGETLIVIEPEYGVVGKEELPLVAGCSLAVEQRMDVDKGGYDSTVIPDDLQHPIWNSIEKKHLRMFNGAFGGEVVSEHIVQPLFNGTEYDVHVLARCGLKLAIPAVFEIVYGKGRVIVSRLQSRGRLFCGTRSDSLYARRPDPVLQCFLINCILYSTRTQQAGNNKETNTR